MPEPEKRSRLAEWGSRPMTGKEKLAFVLVGLLLLVGFIAVMGWVGTGIREDDQALEEQLNDRYQEPVSIRVNNTSGDIQRTIILDGVERFDCEATEDGHLECEDDPQPTLEDE